LSEVAEDCVCWVVVVGHGVLRLGVLRLLIRDVSLEMSLLIRDVSILCCYSNIDGQVAFAGDSRTLLCLGLADVQSCSWRGAPSLPPPLPLHCSLSLARPPRTPPPSQKVL